MSSGMDVGHCDEMDPHLSTMKIDQLLVSALSCFHNAAHKADTRSPSSIASTGGSKTYVRWRMRPIRSAL